MADAEIEETGTDRPGTSTALWGQARTSATTLEKAELIEAMVWANDFSFEQVKSLVSFMDLYKVDAGTRLFSEGDRNPYFVLVLDGLIDVLKRDAHDTPRKISTLSAGKTIGEMSLVDGEPRSASAVTAVPSVLLVMTLENFRALNDSIPGVGNALLMKIARQISQRLRLTSGRLVNYVGD